MGLVILVRYRKAIICILFFIKTYSISLFFFLTLLVIVSIEIKYAINKSKIIYFFLL